MDASKFIFSYIMPAPHTIQATNGPIVIIFSVTHARLRYRKLGSNVTLAWQHMPTIALAAAR